MQNHLRQFNTIEHIADRFDPKSFSEIVFPSEETEIYLKRWVSRRTACRNLLLHGEPGTGKTRAADVLARARTIGTEDWKPINYVECESSTATSLIQNLKRTTSVFQSATHENFEQVFILDEVDNLTTAQQKQLKSVLEINRISYVILTNHIKDIDTGVRSRCFEIKWHVPQYDACKPRLERLAQQMGIPSATEEVLHSAYTTSGWRQMVRNLDVYSMM